MLSKEEIRELFDYNPETGVLTRKSTDNTGTIINTQSNAYVYTSIKGFNIAAHRVIWIWMTGENPDIIDHINGDGMDNRWVNLRNVDTQTNSRNMKKNKRNRSGQMGVKYDHRYNLWHAWIGVDMGRVDLGMYPTKEEAIKARKKAEKEYNFHENHGREK